eukprot:scaffold414248_cov25-Prasinocladus_malaysianus.AAC.1
MEWHRMEMCPLIIRRVVHERHRDLSPCDVSLVKSCFVMACCDSFNASVHLGHTVIFSICRCEPNPQHIIIYHATYHTWSRADRRSMKLHTVPCTYT